MCNNGTFLKNYSSYCSRYKSGLEHSLICAKNNSDYEKFLKEAQSESSCKGLSLYDYLIKPVQRLCKYPLLFRELVKYTPKDHPDYEFVLSTQALFECIAEITNSISADKENVEKMANFILMVDGVTDSEFNTGKQLVRDDWMLVSFPRVLSSNYHVYLFADQLVITKISGNKNNVTKVRCEKLRAQLYLDKFVLKEIHTQGGKHSSALVPINLDNALPEEDYSYYFHFSTLGMKTQWMDDLKRHMVFKEANGKENRPQTMQRKKSLILKSPDLLRRASSRVSVQKSDENEVRVVKPLPHPPSHQKRTKIRSEPRKALKRTLSKSLLYINQAITSDEDKVKSKDEFKLKDEEKEEKANAETKEHRRFSNSFKRKDSVRSTRKHEELRLPPVQMEISSPIIGEPIDQTPRPSPVEIFRNRSKRLLSASPRIINTSSGNNNTEVHEHKRESSLTPLTEGDNFLSKSMTPDHDKSSDTPTKPELGLTPPSTGRRKSHKDDTQNITPYRPRIFANFSPYSPQSKYVILSNITQCNRCSTMIENTITSITFENRLFHDACYTCKQCNISLLNKQVELKTNDIYCTNCHNPN